MSNDPTIPHPVRFPALFDRPVDAIFDQPHASSDGGAVLLKAIDDQLGLTRRVAGCLVDRRDPSRVTHTLTDLVAQRVFGLACGYADANDADRLADDPIQKLILDRHPVTGTPLASQPTLSRFEHTPGPRALYRMGRELAATVIEHHRVRLQGQARRITVDLDVTDDPTHGAQQLSCFHGHYDTWCYLPLLAFLTFDGEPEQYLCAALLRPGNAATVTGARGVIQGLVALLREAFPGTTIRVRLDGGFAHPDLLADLERARVEYVVAMAENAVLTRHVAPLMPAVRAEVAATDATAHVYGDTWYRAKSWPHERRVIMKAEVVAIDGKAPRDNPRFVITNLRQSPQWIYETVYCQRGDVENRIKELHHGLEIDRTSCTTFWANQLRVLLTATAYVLLQELRRQAAATPYARAQVWTLRERLLKIGVWIQARVRRFILHLPAAYADRETWTLIAHRLGAT
ncbi:MAG: IS1380 family transposase [Acidobacteria bacterium]|nr:IS1380 family transposase [Acidobacteriota bacterium]